MQTVQRYSSLFSCIYDEPAPVGQLGRGTHYSIFRCVEWFDVIRKQVPQGQLHHFAVIWDEDHDKRIIPIVERLYLAGLLSPVQFIGENKGCITIILAAKFAFAGSTADSKLYENLVREQVGMDTTDSWEVRFGMFDRARPVNGVDHQCDLQGLIAEDNHIAIAYLRVIDKMWTLGTKQLQEPPATMSSR